MFKLIRKTYDSFLSYISNYKLYKNQYNIDLFLLNSNNSKKPIGLEFSFVDNKIYTCKLLYDGGVTG